MTDQTGNDRYAGTTPQSSQQQSQVQSQSQTQGQPKGDGPTQPKAQADAPPAQAQAPKQPDAANNVQPAQAGSSQYEINTPDKMPHDEDQARRRQQAGEQSDHNPDDKNPDNKGFGYGAQDGEEMADAPDASERGYGGAGEAREKKLDDSE